MEKSEKTAQNSKSVSREEFTSNRTNPVKTFEQSKKGFRVQVQEKVILQR
jgi:hypothetical protein